MELKEKGKYKHFTEECIFIENGKSYTLTSHIYALSNGCTFTKYEKKENNLAKLKENLNKIK